MDQISALMDGEVDAHEARSLVARLKADPASRIRWDEYHLVRDALRGEPLLSARFSETVSKRLAEEPTVLAPQRSPFKSRRVTTYAMSAAASVSAVALVAWVALSPTPENIAQSTKQGPIPAILPASQVTLPNEPSDGRANDLILAHESFSPSTALQGVVPYIRSVSVTRRAERR